MGFKIELDSDVASDLAEDLREVFESRIYCDCEYTCTGGCLFARLTRGYEVLLEAGD